MIAPTRTLPRRRWLVWGVAVVAYVVAVVGRSSLAATGVAAAERFDVSSGVLSLLAVFSLAVYAALQIPAGVLVDRFGPRTLIASGAVLVAVGQAVLAVSTSMPVAVLGRVLTGAGDAVTFVSVLRLVPTWFAPREVPVVNQLSGILGQLGQVVSAVPLAVLVLDVGWTPAYLAASGLALAVVVAVLAVLRPGPLAEPVAGVPATGDRAGPGEVWRSPGTRLAFWCHLASPFPGNVAGLLWGFPYLAAGEGLATGTARTLVAAVVGTNLVLGPLFGAVAGRVPHRRVQLIAAAVVLQALAWSVVVLWPGPAPLGLLVALVVVLGTGGPASLVAFDVARSAVAPERIGRASGVVNVGGFVSTLLVVALVGVILDLQGAGTPDTYALAPFRLAMAVHVPVALVGLAGMAWSARAVRRAESASPPRPLPPPRPAARTGERT